MSMTIHKLKALATPARPNYQLALRIAIGEASSAEVAEGHRLLAKGVKAEEALSYALGINFLGREDAARDELEVLPEAPPARQIRRSTETKAAKRAFAREEARDAYYADYAKALNGRRGEFHEGYVLPSQLVRLKVDEVCRLTGRSKDFVLRVRTAAWMEHSIPV